MPNNQSTDKDAVKNNNTNYTVKKLTKSNAISERARKSFIPLLCALDSRHVEANPNGSNNELSNSRLPIRPPTMIPVSPSMSKFKGKKESHAALASATGSPSMGSISSNVNVSRPVNISVSTGPKITTSRRNLKSVHSSTIRIRGRESLSAIGRLPTGDSSQWKSPKIAGSFIPKKKVESLVKFGKDGTLCIKLPRSPLAPALVKFSLEMGQASDRTRGYFICPICNEPFCNPAIIACGHLFCIRCVSGWFKDQDSCPCCRYPIVMKECSSYLLAKDFSEVTNLLLSTLTAGNFYNHVKDKQILHPATRPSLSEEFQKQAECNEDDRLISCVYSANLLNCVAPIFREIFQKPSCKGICYQIGRKEEPVENIENVKMRNSFIGALWYIRQGLTLRHKLETRLTHRGGVLQEDAEAIIKDFSVITKEEAYYGGQISRESLLAKVMSMKPPHIPGESVPSLDLTNSRRKLLNSNSIAQSPPRFRLRMPSSVGFTKMFMASFLLVVIGLAVYLFDDRRYMEDYDKVRFCKLDFVVYLVTVFTLIAYTESERVAFWRGPQQGRNNDTRTRGDREAYRSQTNIRTLEGLHINGFSF